MNKEILNRFFNNQCSDKEVHEVLIWINSEKAKDDFSDMFDSFDENDAKVGSLEGEVRLNKIRTAINKREFAIELSGNEKKMVTTRGSRSFYTNMRIAAAVVLLIISSIGTYFLMKVNDVENGHIPTAAWVTKVAEAGQKLTVELSDGTKVKLNGDSKLIYPSGFSVESREVTLIGEAFFDVARDESRPFKISSGEINVQVLGTSFLVKSYTEDKKITVAVRSGKVAVQGKKSPKRIELKKYEAIEYEITGQSFEKYVLKNENAFAWMQQSIVFEDNSIEEILTVISRWYGVEIMINKELSSSKKFTAIYKNPTLGAVLRSLSIAYEFEYDVNKKNVIIN